MYSYKPLVAFVAAIAVAFSLSAAWYAISNQNVAPEPQTRLIAQVDYYYFRDPPTPWNNYHGGYPPPYGAHAGEFYGGGYDGWLGYGAFDGYGIYHHHRYFRAW